MTEHHEKPPFEKHRWAYTALKIGIPVVALYLVLRLLGAF